MRNDGNLKRGVAPEGRVGLESVTAGPHFIHPKRLKVNSCKTERGLKEGFMGSIFSPSAFENPV